MEVLDTKHPSCAALALWVRKRLKKGRSFDRKLRAPATKATTTRPLQSYFPTRDGLRACFANREMRQPKQKPKTTRAQQAKAASAARKLVNEAAAWCKANGATALKATQQEKYSNLNARTIHRRITGEVGEDGGVGTQARLLTDREEQQLATWLVDANKKARGKDRAAITTQVLVMLRSRRALRKASRYRCGTTRDPLGFQRRSLSTLKAPTKKP